MKFPDLFKNTGPMIAAARQQQPVIVTDERGTRATPESQVRALYRNMWVDPTLRAAILNIRNMDKLDGRVKRIHSKTAGDVVRGGLVMTQVTENKRIRECWDEYQTRLQLNRPAKLKSDARILLMQGNLPMQWVLDREQRHVVGGVAMPAETLIPNTDQNGLFKDLQKAWTQIDLVGGKAIAHFEAWKLSVARLDPDNYDDMGSLGRPFLDASIASWQKLAMSEEDLVIRRRTRAPQKLAHVLEGATTEELATYRAEVEKNASDIATDFFLNKKGSVTVLQGDAQMGEIKDVIHLLDSWFAGCPFPKFMLGYTDGIARDVVEDLKRGYFDDLDYLQDEQAFIYSMGFSLDLLLKGIVPAGYTIKFAERRTETPNQLADRMLKHAALNIPPDMIYEEMGLDANEVRQRREAGIKKGDPYPDPNGGDGDPGTAEPNVSITPGNARKGESGTSISNA